MLRARWRILINGDNSSYMNCTRNTLATSTVLIGPEDHRAIPRELSISIEKFLNSRDLTRDAARGAKLFTPPSLLKFHKTSVDVIGSSVVIQPTFSPSVWSQSLLDISRQASRRDPNPLNAKSVCWELLYIKLVIHKSSSKAPGIRIFHTSRLDLY